MIQYAGKEIIPCKVNERFENVPFDIIQDKPNMMIVATPRGGHLEFFTTLDIKRVSVKSGIYHLQESTYISWIRTI
jgi:hypothetical protein